MYPVTLFYFIFASNVRASLKIYYKHLGTKFTNALYYEHLRIFAITMVDRFITKIDPKSYEFIYDDGDTPLTTFNEATILVQSHFGGWAASSNLSRTRYKINLVMQETLMDSIKDIEETINIRQNISIIDLNQGTIAVSIAIANALMANEVVAMMGDRASSEKAIIQAEFLGKKANFNKNPFQIAYKMSTPILVYFIIYMGMRKYKVEYIKIDVDKQKPEHEAIEEALYLYVKKYEKLVKRYQNQWLNFFDFWS